jgi:hypothetical protein
LAPETDLTQGRLEGHVEEVDTGRELRLHSVEQFLTFLAECLTQSQDAGREENGG